MTYIVCRCIFGAFSSISFINSWGILWLTYCIQHTLKLAQSHPLQCQALKMKKRYYSSACKQGNQTFHTLNNSIWNNIHLKPPVDGSGTSDALWQLKAIIIKQCTSYMLYLVRVCERFLTVLYQAQVASDNTKAVRKQRRLGFLAAYITVFMSPLLSGVRPLLTRYRINSHPHAIVQEICGVAPIAYIYFYSAVFASFDCTYWWLWCTYLLSFIFKSFFFFFTWERCYHISISFFFLAMFYIDSRCNTCSLIAVDLAAYVCYSQFALFWKTVAGNL